MVEKQQHYCLDDYIFWEIFLVPLKRKVLMREEISDRNSTENETC